MPTLKEYWKYNFTETFWEIHCIRNPMARLMGIDFSKVSGVNNVTT